MFLHQLDVRLLFVKSNLATCHYSSGNLVKAEWLFRELLVTAGAILSPDGNFKLLVMQRLGGLLKDRGEWNDAEKTFLAVDKAFNLIQGF